MLPLLLLFNRFAHSTGPHQLVVGLLGCCVAVFLSCLTVSPPKQKKLQKSTKNRARGTQNGARMHQKWSQNQKNALNRPKWLPDGSQDPFTRNEPQISSNFWVPPGSPKINKNRHFPKKAVPGSAFSSIFAANVVFLDFSIDFQSILDEKSMKKNLFFSSPPRSFSNMATLTKHCILRYESYFFVF